MAFLDATVIVGVLMLLTKAADVLLRPHQQRRLQAFLESVTLRLSYTSMIAGASELARRHPWRLVLLLALLAPLQLFILAPFVAFVMATTLGATQEQIQQFFGGFLFAIMIAAIPAAFVLRWVLRDASGWRIPVRYGSLLTALVMATIGSEWMVGHDITLGSRPLQIVLDVGMIVIGALFTALFIVAWVLAFALIAHVVLRLLEATAWRIVEYQRGAWAAVVAIATVLLGALDLYLKR